MIELISFFNRKLSGDTTDDRDSSYAETEGLLNSLYINLTLFSFFMIFFEAFFEEQILEALYEKV